MFAVRVTVMTALLLAGVLYIFLLSFPHSCRDSQQIIVQVAEDHDINSFGHTVVRFYIIFFKGVYVWKTAVRAKRGSIVLQIDGLTLILCVICPKFSNAYC